jgi:hypothetical protein
MRGSFGAGIATVRASSRWIVERSGMRSTFAAT